MNFSLLVLALLVCLSVLVYGLRNRVWSMLPLGLAIGTLTVRLACVELGFSIGAQGLFLFDFATLTMLVNAFPFFWEKNRGDRFQSMGGNAESLQGIQPEVIPDDDEAVTLALQLAKQDLQLQRMTSHLVEWRQSQCDFITNLSQEMRQPLTTILGFTDMLAETTEIGSAHDIGHTIRRNGQEMLELLADCIDLANLESGKLRSNRKPCGPKQIVDEVAESISKRAKAKGLEVAVEYNGLLPEAATTDGGRLRQILLNLGANAVQFTEEGSVSIQVEMTDAIPGESVLEVSIVDTGIGMSEELQERLFIPFSKGIGRSERLAGTGLGLAICRRLIDILGGEIEVSSTLNRGSCFTVRVPVDTLPNVRMIDPSERTAPPNPAPPREVDLNAHVLVVDDSRDNQKLISYVLKKVGAKVTVASDGAQGVTAAMEADLEGNPYDVILMDMNMPILDGFDATTHLRSVGYSRPIIALTALALEGDRQRCLDAGCDDYLTKPIDRDALLRVVSENCMPTAEIQTPAALVP